MRTFRAPSGSESAGKRDLQLPESWALPCPGMNSTGQAKGKGKVEVFLLASRFEAQ